MPLRIELESLWRRLITRFKARRKTDTDPDDPDYPILLETLQPVTNFDELAQTPEIGYGNVDISAAAASVAIVPLGKRWQMVTFYKGTSINSVGVHVSKNVARATYGLLAPAGTTAALQSFGTRIILDEGWEIWIPQGAGGDSSVSFRFLYLEEDAF